MEDNTNATEDASVVLKDIIEVTDTLEDIIDVPENAEDIPVAPEDATNALVDTLDAANAPWGQGKCLGTTDALRTTLKDTAKNQCLMDAYDVKEVTNAMEDITDTPEDKADTLEDTEDAAITQEDGPKATLRAENCKFQKNGIVGLLKITNCFSWIDANVVSKCKFCALFYLLLSNLFYWYGLQKSTHSE